MMHLGPRKLQTFDNPATVVHPSVMKQYGRCEIRRGAAGDICQRIYRCAPSIPAPAGFPAQTGIFKHLETTAGWPSVKMRVTHLEYVRC
jgi:hypothetical protein